MRVDTRAGSKELLAPLGLAGLPIEPTILPAGDVEFVGNGPQGRPVPVLVEYKDIRDALQCMRDGRFAEQLRTMRTRADVNWLLIEGEWRQNAAGILEVRESRGWKDRGHYTEQELDAWLMTMAQSGGALLWRTTDQAESVRWLRTLYWWWTAKEYEDHRAHLAWYTPPYTPPNPFVQGGPSVAQKVAAALLARGPSVDVNSKRAAAVAAHFGGSVRTMVDADAAAWARVEGIGKGTAEKVVEVLR